MTPADPPPRPAGPPPPPAGAPELDIFRLPLDWRRWWTLVPETVALACAGLLPLVVGANVLSRYTDWYRILWAEDVVKVLFLWVVFLGGAIAVKYEAHVRMSTLSDRLGRRGRAGLLWDRAIRLSPVTMGALLLILGVRIVEISMRRELPTLQISAGYFSTVVPLSGALMIVYAVRGLRPRRHRGADPLR
jgi:TRAP-type C4-dicarboxylate transport system permease small subunit